MENAFNKEFRYLTFQHLIFSGPWFLCSVQGSFTLSQSYKWKQGAEVTDREGLRVEDGEDGN